MDKRCGLIVGIYVLAAWAFAWLTGNASRFSGVVYLPLIANVTWCALLLLMLGVLIKVGLIERPASLIGELSQRFRHDWWPRLFQASGIFLLVLLTLSTFTSIKSLIPEWSVYDWDPFLMSVDRKLHGGFDPWTLSHRLFGGSYVTWLLDLFYRSWFYIMFAVLFWQSFSLKRPELRNRFFLAFYLCWIVNGSILAITFASGGPCYYARFVDGPDPYQPLMHRLAEINEATPLWSLPAQEMLWTHFDQQELALGSGISAMPSMHVAIAFLLYLLARNYGRWWGMGFLCIFLLTLIGSVHLSWHYAVDGYLAVVVSSAIWWLAGRKFVATA